MVLAYVGRVLNFLTPFLFVSLLCAGVYHDKDSAWPAFICFLPIVFLMLGHLLIKLDTEKRLLEKRVKALEEQLSALRLEVDAAA